MTDIILPSDPRAAKRVTVKGWVSRDGRFCGDDEQLARRLGATHAPCSACGSPAPKTYTLCDSCRDKKNEERFLARPAVEWDGKAWIYSETLDEYYSSPNDALDYTEEDEDLRLIVCVPCHVPRLTADFCEHLLPEDSDELPDTLERALYQFNQSVKDLVLSWEPGPNRLKLEEAP